MHFLDSLKVYDKDNIPAPISKKIRDKYINNPDFTPDAMRSVSSACEGLCKWVRAIEVYDGVAKVVAPKRQSLNSAESLYGDHMSKLQVKQNELKAVTDKLNNLNDNLDTKQTEKKVVFTVTRQQMAMLMFYILRIWRTTLN